MATPRFPEAADKGRSVTRPCSRRLTNLLPVLRLSPVTISRFRRRRVEVPCPSFSVADCSADSYLLPGGRGGEGSCFPPLPALPPAVPSARELLQSNDGGLRRFGSASATSGAQCSFSSSANLFPRLATPSASASLPVNLVPTLTAVSLAERQRLRRQRRRVRSGLLRLLRSLRQ